MKKYLFFADYLLDFVINKIKDIFPGKAVPIYIFEYIIILLIIFVIPISIVSLIGNGFFIAGVTILLFYSTFLCSAYLSLFFRED